MSIVYLALHSARLAQRRVGLRVRLGGHDVSSEVIRRRFGRSLINFLSLYCPLADEWILLDNSLPDEPAVVASHNARHGTRIEDDATWQRLTRLATRSNSSP